MKKMKLQLLAAVLCVTSFVSTSAFIRGRSFFSPRSQSVHAERELVGWQEEINLLSCDNYGAFYAMPLYSRSNKPCELAGYFFGAQSFEIAGSQVEDREDALLADYFALPLDYKSTIIVKPVIKNALCDFNFYCGLDELLRGLYLRVHAPYVSATWNMNMRECVDDFGTTAYPAGYMASGTVDRGNMMLNALEWFAGFAKTVGDIQPLKFGKINGEVCATGLSEIQVAVGWNFINNENYHYGLNLRGSIPTGNRSTAVFMFEPMIGNGGHWEFGFGMTGHTIVWHCEQENRYWGLYGDMNVTHLFAAEQRRSFDFKKNGPSSRYILLQEIGTPIVQGLLVDGVPALQQYHGVILPAVNITTLHADVSIALQADIVLKLAYMHDCYTFEFGYDFWARTAENINCRERLPENQYAIKGDAQVYGFNRENQRFVGLNATQSQATMFGGQGDGNGNFLNRNADNSTDTGGGANIATFEFAPGNDELTLNPPVASDMAGSLQAILLTDCDIDTLSAASPAAISHSFFVHVRYAALCCTTVTPFIGIGVETSFDGSGSKHNNALAEWAVWVKGGVSY